MKQTEDIAPLVAVVEREFDRLWLNARSAMNALDDFWATVYGREAADVMTLPLIGALEVVSQEFSGDDEI